MQAHDEHPETFKVFLMTNSHDRFMQATLRVEDRNKLVLSFIGA